MTQTTFGQTTSDAGVSVTQAGGRRRGHWFSTNPDKAWGEKFFLGFIPVYILAKVLNAFGLLRVPRKVELEGLDFSNEQEYNSAVKDVIAAERAMVK